uniref:Uncharacterized protein n=1 Tax=Arundo donax TaxID=35708 RepID=A0A0A9TK38_ARUDO
MEPVRADLPESPVRELQVLAKYVHWQHNLPRHQTLLQRNGLLLVLSDKPGQFCYLASYVHLRCC